MSDNPMQEMSDIFGTSTDPLEQFNEGMQKASVDWYDWYYKNKVKDREKDSYAAKYKLAFDEWREYMDRNHPDRHPTLANKFHIEGWMREMLKRMSGNSVRANVNLVENVYEYLQESSASPHPAGYDPFGLAKRELDKELETDDPDDFPYLSIEDVREQINSIKHVGERACTVLAMKTGARPSEVANVRMEDIHITNEDVLEHYNGNGQNHEEMGSNDQLRDYNNAVYIPTEDEHHPNNKRKLPSVIPIDDETRQAIIDWLLIRPDNGEPWLFLTQKGGRMGPSTQQYVWREKHWTDYQYSQSEEYRSITPHWARHWFTTWFRTKANMPEPWVQYLRGDKQSNEIGSGREALHRYIHFFYEEVENEYRDEAFDLKI